MTDTPQSPNYQDILTKYADSLKSTEIPPIPNEESKMDPKIQLESVPEPEKVESAPLVTPTMLEPDPGAELEPEIEPVSAVMMEADSKTEVIPSSDLSTPMPEVKDQYIAPPTEPTEPIEPEPKMDFPSEVTQIPESDITTEAPIIPPPPPVGYPNIAPDFVPPKENHFFKYLFFFSLVVFIVVAGLVVVSFLDSQKTLTESKNTPTSVPPTGVDVVGCEINGKKYSFGESFKADDGCNTCSCGEDKQIACTLMACESSTSASPTKSATTSAIPADWKTFTDKVFGFSFQHPVGFELEQQGPGGSAVPDGQYHFLSKRGKGDSFFIDIVSFSGSVNQLITKYTPIDPLTNQKEVKVNSLSTGSLGTLVTSKDNTNVVWYKSSSNPGSFNYTGFVVINGNGFIIRANNDTTDNLAELKQIVSTFKTTNKLTPIISNEP